MKTTFAHYFYCYFQHSKKGINIYSVPDSLHTVLNRKEIMHQFLKGTLNDLTPMKQVLDSRENLLYITTLN
jgi:hypothetical protein